VPELPEVETIRRALEPELLGRRLTDPWAFDSPKFTPGLAAADVEIVGVGRRAKFLLLGLHDGRELVVHLGMTGTLHLGDAVEDPYVRARWSVDDDRVLTFRDVRRFGRLRVVPAGDYRSIPTLAAAGPEPFDPAFDGAHLHAEVKKSRRHLKTQLLAQRAVAGLGNIYADEALWLAGVNPAVRTLTRRQADALADAIVEVLAAGVRNGGTTLRDYRSLDGESGRNQHHLHAYGRAGQSCDRCASTLRSRVLDARTTTWCPTCQRR
jgi:formamidopyrimidine-DNA glycosylase